MKNVVNCCVVVVRYFGGVLLGTGGLVRAYTQAAQLAVESAGIVRMERTTEEYCEVPYSVWDRFRHAVNHLPVRMEGIKYGKTVSFTLCYRTAERESVIPFLLNASDRKLLSVPQQETFAAWKI